MIEKRKKHTINEGYVEKHHIIPKSMGGNNRKENIVKLTPREHFIAHALLTKMCFENKHKISMACAFFRMNPKNNFQKRKILNSKLYEKIRKNLIIFVSGENNAFYGKKHTEDTKRKMKSNRKKFSGENNPFYGKKHSENTKVKMKNNKSIPFKIVFSNNHVQSFSCKNELGPYLNKSVPLGVKILKEKFFHLTKKYNIQEIIYENKNN